MGSKEVNVKRASPLMTACQEHPKMVWAYDDNRGWEGELKLARTSPAPSRRLVAGGAPSHEFLLQSLVLCQHVADALQVSSHCFTVFNIIHATTVGSGPGKVRRTKPPCLMFPGSSAQTPIFSSWYPVLSSNTNEIASWQNLNFAPTDLLMRHAKYLRTTDRVCLLYICSVLIATVTTRRTCFCVLSTCKNVGKRRASVRGEYHLHTESYGSGSMQTRRRTLSVCKTFSACGMRVYHPCVRVRATRVPRTAYERATYGLRESNFTILTCNCCTDSARNTCVPRTVFASSVLTPHFPVDLLNDHAEQTCTIPDDLTGDCQLSKMPRKAQKKTTRQDPKKRAGEDTRAASDDEVNRRCTHLQRASTACRRQRRNSTEIVRCKHVQLTYHLRNVRCTQPLTARRVVQTTPWTWKQTQAIAYPVVYVVKP
ncbi:hypothetical protein Bbelb_021340 [Branchiostoma belcheri]|nr:hypothetical protein Bbelb_021340 [Branchiostoma belcheri]